MFTKIYKYNIITGQESPSTIRLIDDEDYVHRLVEMHNNTVPNFYYWPVRIFEVNEEKWNENVETCSDCGIQWKKIGKSCPVCYSPLEVR